MCAAPAKVPIIKVSKAEAKLFIENILRKRRQHLSESERKRTCNRLLKKAFQCFQEQEKLQQRKKCKNSKKLKNKIDRSTSVISLSPNRDFIKYHINQGPRRTVSQEYPERLLWTLQSLSCIKKLTKPKKRFYGRKRNFLVDYKRKKIQKMD